MNFLGIITFVFVIVKGGYGQCPEKNGRFPVQGQCDAYIECVDGVAEEKLCPDGLLFNDKVSPFTFPCQYPIDVSCENRAKLQPPQATDECPHQFGYYRLGDSAHCGQFMNCASGRGFVFDCPEGLAFNQETYRCDWPDQVGDCDTEAFLGFRCPEVAKSQYLGQEEIRFFKSSADCIHYFVCLDGRPRMYSCGEGLAFNELINACDGAENVTGCAVEARTPTLRVTSQPIVPQQKQQPRITKTQFGGQQSTRSSSRTRNLRESSQFPYAAVDSFQCPEENGKFPIDGQCDAYIECKNGVAEEKLCPDGLRFNDNLSPKGECQYAPSVNCTNRPKLQSPNATDNCPRQFGFYRIGNSAQCNQYMNCAHGIGKITKCPEGLAFNQNTYRCDWPDQVEDCDAEAYLNFTCPQYENERKTQKFNNKLDTTATDDDSSSDNLKYYRHSKNCKKYYVCVNDRPRLYTCSKFLVFNYKTNLCDSYTNVPQCRRKITSKSIQANTNNDNSTGLVAVINDNDDSLLTTPLPSELANVHKRLFRPNFRTNRRATLNQYKNINV